MDGPYTTTSSSPSVHNRPRLVSYSSFETIDREHVQGASGEAATNEGARLLISIILSLTVRGEGHFLVLRNNWGHYTFQGNCPPTPPLSQHFALSET